MGEGASTNSGCNDEEFDEFGFKVDVEDGPEQSSSKLLSTPFQDNPQQRYIPISKYSCNFSFISENCYLDVIRLFVGKSFPIGFMVCKSSTVWKFYHIFLCKVYYI